MVIQERIHKIGWLGEKSLANVAPSYKYSSARTSIAGLGRERQQKTLSLVTPNVRWFAYALMVLGVGCIVAAFLQDSQVHPWMPLLLGWAGTMAIIRGILSKDSHNA